MRVLVLDISGSTGFAELEALQSGEAGATTENVGRLRPIEYGVIKLEKTAKSYAKHPWGYVEAANDLADKLLALIQRIEFKSMEPLSAIVIEETNGARQRFTQKFLEYCHLALLNQLRTLTWHDKVVYVNTSDWRRKMDVRLTKEDKSQNAKLSRNKRKAADKGEKLDKKTLGIRGRTTIKHVAIRRANELFGLSLLAKDDDIADALLIGSAYLRGVEHCNGMD
jgi:hypothetical protein